MRLILLLLLSTAVFAQPPIDDVIDHNANASLDDFYNSSIAINSSVLLNFGNISLKNLSVSSSMEIAGMNLMLDNMTYPVDGLSLMVAWGSLMDHLVAKKAEGYPDFICDRLWYDAGAGFAWRCDFDNDNCVEFENRTWIERNLDVTFTFRNKSRSVPSSSNAISVPEDILEEMK